MYVEADQGPDEFDSNEHRALLHDSDGPFDGAVVEFSIATKPAPGSSAYWMTAGCHVPTSSGDAEPAGYCVTDDLAIAETGADGKAQVQFLAIDPGTYVVTATLREISPMGTTPGPVLVQSSLTIVVGGA